MASLLRVPPYMYAHVEDRNTCDVWTVLGPIVVTLSDNHSVVLPPQPCVVIPSNHYHIIRNPVHRSGQELSTSSDCGIGKVALCQFPLACTDAWPSVLRQPSAESVGQGRTEYRFAQAPFPLFPGEELVTPAPQPQPLLRETEALVLRAVCDFTHDTTRAPGDADKANAQIVTATRKAQDLFLFRGPGRYTPRLEEEVVERVERLVVSDREVLRLRAKMAFTDDDGTSRVAGESWLHTVRGPLFLHPCVMLIGQTPAVTLNATTALHVRAVKPFTDTRFNGRPRRAGERWLLTLAHVAGPYVPSDYEEVEQILSLTVVEQGEYVVVRHPVQAQHTNEATASTAQTSGQNAWGVLELREGPTHFFLQPGEELADGAVKSGFVLREDEALLVEAREGCTVADADKTVARDAGERWLVRGPLSYIPPLTVRVVELRRVILLSHNQGVYVRDTRTGRICSVKGAPFMLGEYDQLWAKRLSPAVRRLLQMPRQTLRVEDAPELFKDIRMDDNDDLCGALGSFTDPPFLSDGKASAHRHTSLWHEERPASFPVAEFVGPSEVHRQETDMTPYAIVSAKVENNTLMRLYDVSTGKCRVIQGPAEVFLEPHEQFTHMLLSGGRPKQTAQMQCLSLYLGPDYMSDAIEVETLDHANLRLVLAYNWEFSVGDVEKTKEMVFSVPDFIGEACKTLASRVRTAIATETFDNFHRNSSSLIKRAVFSSTQDGITTVVDDVLYFNLNGLMITNVDVQSVEPVDIKTRVALTKSVQLAVEIITKTQENEATHNATLLEQEASGMIQLQVTRDKADAEASRGELLQGIAANLAIELAGNSTAQATAESKARLVEASAQTEVTPLRCEAHEIAMDAELAVLRQRMEADLAHRKAMNELAITKSEKLAAIEAEKYEQVMSALGRDTVVALARAGPELQQKLLGALGLEGFLMTDGTVPVNLMNLTQRLAAPTAAHATSS